MRLGHIPRVEACDPSPTGGGEVDEDCTMASPVHVCRAVCEGVCLLGGRLFYNMPITRVHTKTTKCARGGCWYGMVFLRTPLTTPVTYHGHSAHSRGLEQVGRSCPPSTYCTDRG